MNPLTTLKNLYLEYHRFTYPTYPEYARSYPTYFSKSRETNGLTRCIIAWFRLHGWHAERITSMGRRVGNRRTFTDVAGRMREVGTTTWIPGTSMKGTADIEAACPSLVKIEVKNAKTRDRMRPDQEVYRNVVSASGVEYYVVRSLEEFAEWYRFGVNPRREEFWRAMKEQGGI